MDICPPGAGKALEVAKTPLERVIWDALYAWYPCFQDYTNGYQSVQPFEQWFFEVKRQSRKRNVSQRYSHYYNNDMNSLFLA